MFLFSLGFLLGDVYLQTLSALPNKYMVITLALCTVGSFILLRKYRRYFIFFFAILCGFFWSDWYAATILSWSLPKNLEGKPLNIIGYIASLPQNKFGQTSFVFKVEKIEDINQKVLIRLIWRNPDKKIKVGDKWQLRVKLKRIHSTQNPGAFDFEAWAIQNKLRATGFVIENDINKIIAHDVWKYFVDRYRQKLKDKIEINLPASNTSPWLLALIIGERAGIPDTQWEVLRKTGTNHLMVIAGLHIGTISSFAYYLILRLWRLIPALILRIPIQQAASCAALLIAIFYSALAGFSLPTQRACLMLLCFTSGLILRKKIFSWQSWSIALFFVLLINPLSVLSESFWLSFGTIALIIYGMGARLNPTGLWWKYIKVQWVIGAGLVPLSLYFFQQCSFISFVANSIAIPWLSFFILPFCLLSSLCLFISPLLGKLFLIIADKSLAGLWIVLIWFSHLNIAAWQQVIPSNSLLCLTIFAFIFLFLPAGFPGRWFGLFWLMPLLSYQPEKPERNGYWLTLLDVGQGLSVIIETKAHTLIYDTGPNINGFDMGKSVVIPYLNTRTIKKIDMLVISHGDNDHIGGANAILNTIPIKLIKTSMPEKIKFSSYCLVNENWEWDGVKFSFLYPTKENLGLGNDSSCVLKIDNGKQSVLLTGDIEKFAERELISYSNQSLHANILIAPHHGSKTSGLKSFIQAVHPQYVLYAIGYRNRYHFPNSSIIAAYDEINAKQINTTDNGAVQFQILSNKDMLIKYKYRKTKFKYWFDS